MPWYGWVLAVLAVFTVAAVAAALLTRRSDRGRRFWALPARRKLLFGRTLLRDPGTPLVARAGLVLLVAYLVLPFDIIPDFIPVLGQVDDVLAIALAVALLLAFVPADRIEAALDAAERPGDRG